MIIQKQFYYKNNIRFIIKMSKQQKIDLELTEEKYYFNKISFPLTIVSIIISIILSILVLKIYCEMKEMQIQYGKTVTSNYFQEFSFTKISFKSII